MMDLRHIVHSRHAVIELAQATEELVDVNVLRTIHRRELQQNEFEVSRVPARRVGPVIDENPVGEEAPQHRLELMVMRVDEPGHDNATARVDGRGTASLQVVTDRDDLLALDQHVGLREIADRRVHRHHRTTANDVAPSWLAAVARCVTIRLCGRGRRGQQIEACRGDCGRRRRFREIAP